MEVAAWPVWLADTDDASPQGEWGTYLNELKSAQGGPTVPHMPPVRTVAVTQERQALYASQRAFLLDFDAVPEFSGQRRRRYYMTCPEKDPNPQMKIEFPSSL